MGEAGDKAARHRIADHREDDRDGARLGQQSPQLPTAEADDDVRPESHQLLGIGLHALAPRARKAVLEDDVAAVDPAQVAQARHQGACLLHPGLIFGAAGRRRQVADAADALGRLCPQAAVAGDRQNGCRQQIAPGDRAAVHGSRRRAVTSISIFMRGSTRPQISAVAAGRIVANAAPRTGMMRGQSAASGT